MASSPEKAHSMDEAGYQFAKMTIQEGFSHLERAHFSAYYEHWMHPLAIGDPTDCAIVLRYLLGPAAYTVLDLKLVDVSQLFEGNVDPSWVAASLVEVESRGKQAGPRGLI